MQLPEDFENLVTSAQSSSLYKNLILQLNKDLALANVALAFDEDTLPTSLKLLLQEMVFQLIQEKFMDYLHLLYIVDVPEPKIKALDANNIVTLSESVTFLILQREWQKVWYKAKFS